MLEIKLRDTTKVPACRIWLPLDKTTILYFMFVGFASYIALAQTYSFFFWNTNIKYRCLKLLPVYGHLVFWHRFCLSSLIVQAFCDLEPIYTYEGTYEINTLVTGREVTGFASFKPATQRSRMWKCKSVLLQTQLHYCIPLVHIFVINKYQNRSIQ